MPVPSKWNMSNAFLNLVTERIFWEVKQIRCYTAVQYLNTLYSWHLLAHRAMCGQSVDWLQPLVLPIQLDLYRTFIWRFLLIHSSVCLSIITSTLFLWKGKMTEYNNTVMLFIGLFLRKKKQAIKCNELQLKNGSTSI